MPEALSRNDGSEGLSGKAFFQLLESLQPKTEYLQLFRAVVLHSWKAALTHAQEIVARVDARIGGLEQRIRDYTHAFVVANPLIPKPTPTHRSNACGVDDRENGTQRSPPRRIKR